MAEEEIRASKLKNLEALKALGVNPYPITYKREMDLASIVKKFVDGGEQAFKVKTAGRLMLIRMQGKAGFSVIKDESGKIQIYVRLDFVGEQAFQIFKHMDLGDIVGVEGEVFRTRTNEITIKVESLTLLSKIIETLPEKFHGLTDVETRVRKRYLDLIMNDDVREVFRKRSLVVRTIRRFLEERGFLEVETPMLQPLYGGAAAKPFVTHHNTLDMDMFLRISPELYLKRLMVGGFERVYEMNRNFRNEGISFKHNPEFTMIEIYQAYADYNDMMDLVEEIVCAANAAVNPSPKIRYRDQEIDLARPWKRVKLLELMKEKTGLDFGTCTDADAADAAKKAGIDLEPGLSKWKIMDEIFKVKVEPFLIQPTIVYDYPREISPLAKQKPDDPDIVERFEPYIAGQEIGNAFSELNDPLEQRARFEGQLKERAKGDDEAHRMDEDFVSALEFGMPPTGGLGIGIDRVAAILLDRHSIREIILFPALRPEQN
jgi:lysyl-tRNA synthetase class 2